MSLENFIRKLIGETEKKEYIVKKEQTIQTSQNIQKEPLVNMQEKNTSLMSQILWSGFKTGTVPYSRLKREKGKSRWTLSKKIKLVIDSLLGFSYLPIRLISIIGILLAFASFIGLCIVIYRNICYMYYIYMSRL